MNKYILKATKDKEEIYSEVVDDMFHHQIINENTYDNILGYVMLT